MISALRQGHQGAFFHYLRARTDSGHGSRYSFSRTEGNNLLTRRSADSAARWTAFSAAYLRNEASGGAKGLTKAA